MGSILGGNGPSKGSKLPAWARNTLEQLVQNPSQGWGAAGGWGQSPGSPYGPFSDVTAGYNSMPGSDLFGSLGGLPQMAGAMGPYYANAGMGASNYAAQNAQGLMGSMGYPTAGAAGGLNAMMPGFLGASAPYMGALQSLVGADPSAIMKQFGIGAGGRSAASPFSGGVAGAALGQLGNELPNGDIYNRAMSLLKPQVRSSFSDRGMGGPGAAVKEEGNQAQQLADQLAQQSAQNRIGLLNAGAAGEGANASMTNALGSWNLGLGQQGAQLYDAMIRGAQGGAMLPSSIFQGLQGGLGAGANTLSSVLSSGLNPLQALLQGQNLGMQGLQMPGAIAQQLYSLTRSPYLQMLQAGAGSAPLDQGQSYKGLFGTPKA